MNEAAGSDTRAGDGLAQYRTCDVCHESGADIATRMFVADYGGDHTDYAHADCAEAAGAGVISP
ncbi:hypothetical protein ACFWBX_19675 [Streptomyces sp. NPDC059991]|uniref:hypothetical protein n=1 Tax=Streptomyces sp. NPDC059991 TaxID=3347028 RepID=UPI00367CDF28